MSDYIARADALIAAAQKETDEAEDKVASAEKFREECMVDLTNAEALLTWAKNNLAEVEAFLAQAKATLAAVQSVKTHVEEVHRYLANQTTPSSLQDAFLKGLIETPEG